MALAGYFSFFTGHLCDSFGFKKGLVGGTFIYSIGVFLRLFPSSPVVAVASGLIAGVGASICLSAFRVWMVSISTDETRPRLVGLKSSTMALGTAFGCFSLPLLNYQNLLLTSAAGLALLACVFGFTLPQLDVSLATTKKPAFIAVLKNFYRRHGSGVMMTLVLGATTGFYVSFISPYLPLIMKDRGLNLSAIGLSTGAFALLRFFIDPSIAKCVARYRERALTIFIASEVLIGLVTAAFLLPYGETAFLVLLLMRSGALGFSAISEEILWFKIFPIESVGLFFGLNQSAYFIGDFAGGLINGYLYKRHGLDLCIEVVLVIMLINASLFFWLFKRSTKPVGARPESLAVE